MAVYLVRSTDPGAPTLSGTNGAGVTVLDFILVTTAGLTIQDTSANARNYVMPNGDILHVDHDSAVTGQAYFMQWRAAESASAINTLVDPYPLTSQAGAGASIIRVSSTANATTRAWYAVVDTSATTGCFYFFSNFASGGYVSGACWFGGTDISCLPTDNYAAGCYNVNNSGTGTTIPRPANFVGTVASTSGTLFLKRSRDGAIKSVRAGGAMICSAGTDFGGIVNGPNCPSPDDGKIRMTDISVCDNYSQSTTAGASSEAMRLYVPRAFQPLHALSGYGSVSTGDTWADSAYGASAKFIMMLSGSSSGSTGAFIIQYDGAWTNPSG